MTFTQRKKEKIPYLVTSGAKNISPGPGMYSTREEMAANVPKISIKNRIGENPEILSAPYREIPSTVGTGCKFSLKGRPNGLHADETPGPTYVPEGLGQNAPQPTIHVRTNELGKDVTPGPGQYQTNLTLLDMKKASVFHGPKDRTIQPLDDNPGPGQYSVADTKPVATIKIGVKTKEINHEKDITPGPGNYNQPHMEPSKTKGYIGVQMQTRELRNTFPGPADYATTSDVLHNTPRIQIKGKIPRNVEVNDAPYTDTRAPFDGPKFSFRSRHELAGDKTPGVNYSPPSFGAEAVPIKITGTRTELQQDIVPGPGTYESPKTFGKQGVYASFHGPKARSIASPRYGPSPADYTYDYKKVISSSPRVTIGKRIALGKKETYGEYVNLGTTFAGPKYSMKGRHSLDLSFG